MPMKPATEDEMLKEGFPKELQTTFEKTAEETQCIILTRVPGGATTELIAAGHDLKGFFIKAKSCDWGPMSGFLCQHPAFNKKGVKGIEFNAKQNLEYVKKFSDRLRSPQESLSPQTVPKSEAEAIKKIFSNNKLEYLTAWDQFFITPKIEDRRVYLKSREERDIIQSLYNAAHEDFQKTKNAQRIFIENYPNSKEYTTQKLEILQKNDVETYNAYIKQLKLAIQDLVILLGEDSPFVPLEIAQQVYDKNWNLMQTDSRKGTHPPVFQANITLSNRDKQSYILYGIAVKKFAQSLVCLSYLIEPEEIESEFVLYKLYYGDIFVCEDVESSKKLLPFEQYWDSQQKVNQDSIKKYWVPDSNEETIQIGKFKIVSSTPQNLPDLFKRGWNKAEKKIDFVLPQNYEFTNKFYPIKGIQNYYPPFRRGNAYKNAVTGDYDLFACWPKIAAGSLEDLIRGSELKETEETLFSRMSSKQHSLRSNVSKNMFVEFIPTPDKLKGTLGDHPSFGNTNGLVTNVAGTLNAFTSFLSQNPTGMARTQGLPKISDSKDLLRNVAFHGDEGGRPGIDEADYDIAAFVPASLIDIESISKKLGVNQPVKKGKMFLIKEHVDLLTLIDAVKSECYVPLNFAWVYDFLTRKHKKLDQSNNEVADEETDKAVEDRLKALFCTPPKDAKAPTAAEKKRQETELKELRDKFKKLFSDDAKTWTTDTKIAHVLNSDSTVEANKS